MTELILGLSCLSLPLVYIFFHVLDHRPELGTWSALGKLLKGLMISWLILGMFVMGIWMIWKHGQ